MLRIAAVVAIPLALFSAATSSATHAVFESDRYDSPEEAPFVEVEVYLTDTGEQPRPGPGESLEYRTEDIDATGGADYEPTAGTVRFEMGEESKTLRIPLFDDSRREGVEAFRVHVRNTLGGAPSSTTVFLEDGESPPAADPFGSAAGGAPEPVGEGRNSTSQEASRPAGAADTPSTDAPRLESRSSPDSALRVGTGFDLKTGAPEPSNEGQPAKRGSTWPVAVGAGVILLAAGGAFWRRRTRWSPTQP